VILEQETREHEEGDEHHPPRLYRGCSARLPCWRVPPFCAGFNEALTDMTTATDILKAPAPPATKYVLPRELGGIFT